MRSLPGTVLDLVTRHDGVVSRRQLLDLGITDGRIRAWCGARLLTSVHPGVYVDHTGPLTWRQRAAAAVRYAEPAALHGTSALRAAGCLRSHDDRGPVVVAVEQGRTVVAQPGLQVRRVRGLAERVLWHLDPPRSRIEDAALDVAAAAADDLAAVAVLAEVVTSRRTTAARLQTTAGRRLRLARRQLITESLADIANGACSVLERAYLRDGRTGARAAGGRTPGTGERPRCGLRDVLHARFGVVVELDGRLDHTRVADRDRDLDRDLVGAVDGLLTLRLGWGQCLGRPCDTAARVGAVLRRRGWQGFPTPCPRRPATTG